MMKKLRTLLAAALLVPALFSNASAFTTESNGDLTVGRPTSGVCWFNAGGMWFPYPC